MSGEATRIVAPESIRACRNTTGATILKNTVVKLSQVTRRLVLLPAALTDHIYGVTMEDIKDGSWGDVQVSGCALCRAHGALANTGIKLMAVNATGRVVLWAPGGAGLNANLVGLLETTALAQDDLVEVELAGPGVVEQQ